MTKTYDMVVGEKLRSCRREVECNNLDEGIQILKNEHRNNLIGNFTETMPKEVYLSFQK